MIDTIHRFIIPAAYDLLPSAMNTAPATAMLLAIGLQESRFRHRRQVGGPAHGFWQFERGGGVAGVMKHDRVGPIAREVLAALRYDAKAADVYDLIVDNDVLAAVIARLLLWTVPGRLPLAPQAEMGWQQYREGWRPGKPHRATWNDFYAEAWARVTSLAHT
jgi:hypothetical protein